MKLRLTTFALCALITPLVIAQGKSENARLQHAPRLSVKAKASKVNTFDFAVQIDEVFRPQPRKPKNPFEYPDYPGTINDLPVGQIGQFNRLMNQATFPGITATGWTPADPDIAVGPNHVVAVVNSSIAFFTKSGTLQYQQTSTNFFSVTGATSFQFDPKVVYDRIHGRYVILFDELDDLLEQSYILMAISDDNDPNGVWYLYRFNVTLGDVSQNYWLDYPGFGYNKDGYVVSGNMFGFLTGFAGVQFIAIPSGPMLSGGDTTPSYFLDSGGASVQMAEMIDASNTNVFGVSRNGTSTMRVYSIYDLATNPGGVFANVTVPTNSAPNRNAYSTSGRTLSTVDGRVFNAVWRGGRLVTAHTITGSSMIGSRWYELSTGSWPSAGSISLVQAGNVENSSMDMFMPAVNRNAQGDISMIFTGSSTSTTANIMIAGRMNGDPAGAMGTPTVLESATGNNYTQGRWGDYFGCDVDPADDTTFWGVAMTVRSDNNWKTSIYNWTVTGQVTSQLSSLTINPTKVIGGSSATGTVLLTSPAPAGGTVVALSSSSQVATVPSVVTVPAGSSSVSFTITTVTVKQNSTVTVTATSGGISKTATLAVQRQKGGRF